MADIKTENRGRVRQKTAENNKPANKENGEPAQKADVEKIAAAIHAIEQELNRANDDNSPQKKSERNWERAGIIGLWVAALVGLGAVIVASCDSSAQRGVMQGQLDEFKAEQRPWVGIQLTLQAATKAGEPFKVSMIAANVGHKPARKLRLQARAQWIKPSDNILPYMSTFDSNVKAQGDGLLILPGSTVPTFPAPIDIPDANQTLIDGLQSRQQQIMIDGRVEYFIEGDETAHYTIVRAVYDPVSHTLVSLNPGNDAN